MEVLDRQAACTRARESLTQATELLLRVGADQGVASEVASQFIGLWQDLRNSVIVLGQPHPLGPFPTVWNWYARTAEDLSDPSAQRACLAGQSFALLAFLDELEGDLARGEEELFDVRYYIDQRGLSPVVEYLKALRDKDAKFKLQKRMILLKQLTREQPYLSYPQGDALQGEYGDGQFELRVRSDAQHRVLYRLYGSTFVLLHAFQKPDWEVPDEDKKTAHQHWLDFLDRIDAVPSSLGPAAP